jgi:AraC-like DNA-binding protein
VQAFRYALEVQQHEVVCRIAESLWMVALERQFPALCALDVDVLAAASRVVEKPEFCYQIRDLARFSGLSRSRFTERFRFTFGEPPSVWVQRVRMRYAQQMLESGMRAPW